MSAFPLRLAIVAAIAAVPVVLLAACAGDGNASGSSSDTSALTEADTSRMDGLILEAFATSTPTNFTTDLTSNAACLSTDPGTKVLQWNVLGGQWFAPTLRAGLSQRGVTEQLTVIETPSTTTGLLDIQFVGTPTNLDGQAPSLCGADGGVGSSMGLLVCKGIASAGVMTSITLNQCTH